MKKLFYYVLVLLHAEANAGVFPKNVENECSYSWTLKDSSGPPAFRKGNDTVNANISLLAELRDTKNSLQEKAYIYISCSGEAPEINVAPYFEYSKFKTLCVTKSRYVPCNQNQFWLKAAKYMNKSQIFIEIVTPQFNFCLKDLLPKIFS